MKRGKRTLVFACGGILRPEGLALQAALQPLLAEQGERGGCVKNRSLLEEIKMARENVASAMGTGRRLKATFEMGKGEGD